MYFLCVEGMDTSVTWQSLFIFFFSSIPPSATGGEEMPRHFFLFDDDVGPAAVSFYIDPTSIFP
jgi:hypothetical protein